MLNCQLLIGIWIYTKFTTQRKYPFWVNKIPVLFRVCYSALRVCGGDNTVCTRMYTICFKFDCLHYEYLLPTHTSFLKTYISNCIENAWTQYSDKWQSVFQAIWTAWTARWVWILYICNLFFLKIYYHYFVKYTKTKSLLEFAKGMQQTLISK
jgi:hypothetical protein